MAYSTLTPLFQILITTGYSHNSSETPTPHPPPPLSKCARARTHTHKGRKKGVWKDAYSMPINSIAVYFAVPSFGTVWWAITFCRQASLEQTKYVLMLTVQRKRWVWSIFRFAERKMKDDKTEKLKNFTNVLSFHFCSKESHCSWST